MSPVITDKELPKTVEKMLFIISHDIRKQVATCLGLIEVYKLEKEIDEHELDIIMEGLEQNIEEIDSSLRKLSDCFYLNNNSLKNSTPERTMLLF